MRHTSRKVLNISSKQGELFNPDNLLKTMKAYEAYVRRKPMIARLKQNK